MSPPCAETARLPHVIVYAMAAVNAMPIPPALARTLHELLRCVSASSPGQPIRVSVAHLCERMSRSRNTVSRYLAALVRAGLIERWQPKRGARRWGFRCGYVRLTAQALESLGLQRAPSAAHAPNPVSQGEAAWRRVRRIPHDLAALATRIGAARVVWLMSRCRAAGRRLQEFAAQALQADSPAGWVLRALRHPGGASTCRPGPATAATGGDSRQSARAYLAECEKAGCRTEAGRLAGLELLRALRR